MRWLGALPAVLLCALARADAPAPSPAISAGHVVKVTSGDSLQLLLPTGGRAARIASIDAPEGTQPYGAESLQALRAMVEGKDVGVTVVGQDRFKRLLVVMQVGDVDVAEWLLRHGHAWAYREYLRDPAFCRLEAEARTARRGLWAQPPADWIYPSEWRRVQRAKRSAYTDLSGETAEHCSADIGKDRISPP
jgi:endonuclease YncB( thermonuclease family)